MVFNVVYRVRFVGTHCACIVFDIPIVLVNWKLEHDKEIHRFQSDILKCIYIRYQGQCHRGTRTFYAEHKSALRSGTLNGRWRRRRGRRDRNPLRNIFRSYYNFFFLCILFNNRILSQSKNGPPNGLYERYEGQ